MSASLAERLERKQSARLAKMAHYHANAAVYFRAHGNEERAAESETWLRENVRCRACGRALHNDLSKTLGIGPEMQEDIVSDMPEAIQDRAAVRLRWLCVRTKEYTISRPVACGNGFDRTHDGCGWTPAPALDETARWLAAYPEPPEYVSDPGDEPEPDWWERCKDAVQAVRRLHQDGAGSCMECSSASIVYQVPWPCPTERAIAEALGET